jgi:hypothetical protein
LKFKSKPRFDDRRSLVHAHSRLENKVTSDAIDWELPVALRYGLTRLKISDRKLGKACHAVKVWMANAENVNRSLARGLLHRLVRRLGHGLEA